MRKLWMILLLALALTGCKSIADIRPDTIVDIPLHPTEVQSEAATEMTSAPTEQPTETLPVTEATEPSESATQPPKTNTGSKPSGSKKPSQGSGSKKPAATQPPTQPPTAAPTEPPTEVPTEDPTNPQAYDPSGYSPGSLDRSVADLINVQRQAGGLGALRFDNRLCAIASVRARETAQTWNSTRPDGRSGITVLAEYGYGYSMAAENLYFGPANAAAMVDKWMGSDSRRANLLMEAADTIGVGSYTAADGTTFVAVLIVG